MLWISMKAAQVAVSCGRLKGGGGQEEWREARSSQRSARAGQDRQLVRQTAHTERSNTTRERAGRLGSDIRIIQATYRFTYTYPYFVLRDVLYVQSLLLKHGCI